MSIWRPRTTGILIGGFLVIVIAVAASFMLANFQPKTELRLGSGVFKANVASDQLSRETGLAGVEKMKPNDALIIAFDQDDAAGIWMKGMEVSIDIVWLNANKEVIHIVKNATPEMGERIFRPTTKARYVVELPAGTVQKANIKVGGMASFDLEGEVL